MNKSYRLLIFFFLFIELFDRKDVKAQTDFWENISGPQGNVNAIGTNSKGAIFAAIKSGGMIRSTDNGENWDLINNGLTNYEITAIAIDLNDKIFLGTSDVGIFCSTNNGNDWVYINSNLEYTQIQSLFVDKIGNIFAGGSQGRIVKSTDQGNTWTKIADQLSSDQVSSLCVNSKGYIFAGTSIGIYRSTDNGKTWLHNNNGLKDSSVFSIATDNNDILLCGTKNGIYRSTDYGASWHQVSNRKCYTLAINSTNDIYAGTYGACIRSIDSGLSWEILFERNSDGIYSIAFSKPDRIYAGIFGEIYRSKDNAKNWIDQSVILQEGGGQLAISSYGTIIVGNRRFFGTGRIYRSTNGGKLWYQTNSGMDNSSINTVYISPNGSIFTGNDTRIYRSTDDGRTFQVLRNTSSAIYYSLVSNKQGQLFAGCSFGVLRSTDNGESWKRLDNGLPIYCSVYSIAVKQNDNLFIGTDSSSIYRSTDNGDHWTIVYNSIKKADLDLPLGIDSNGNLFAGVDGCIQKSTDDGNSWTKHDYDLGTQYYSFPFCFFIHQNGQIFLGTTVEGIYRSLDGGNTWKQLNSGLGPFLQVQSIAMENKGNLYAGLQHGVYKSVQPITSIINISSNRESSFSLVQNHPNPFTSSTSIQFQLQKPTHVTLKIFNTLGVEIKTLIENQEYDAGTHSIDFEPRTSNFEPRSGIYFYQLITPEFTQTKKMIVVR